MVFNLDTFAARFAACKGNLLLRQTRKVEQHRLGGGSLFEGERTTFSHGVICI